MAGMPDHRYAYLGPPGTFTEAAVHALDGAAHSKAVPYPSVEATLDAVRDGWAELGVVPIENSVEGAVTATLDGLASGRDLIIRAEVSLPVSFALLAWPGTTLAEIRVVSGHPVAQPQCRRWLAASLPDAEWRPASSNAEAARQAAAGTVDAALAGAFAAEVYGLAVLAEDINDADNAETRFVAVSLPGPLPEPTGADKTSVVASLAEDHPGALMEILSQFAVRGINLTRIESRPTGDRLGRYCFSIDCEGHAAEERVGEALMGLHRICRDVRFLGSYPRSDGGRAEVAPGTSDADFAEAATWLARLRAGEAGR
jgi:prephenate dehydratase